jgi:hypothetical protein
LNTCLGVRSCLFPTSYLAVGGSWHAIQVLNGRPSGTEPDKVKLASRLPDTVGCTVEGLGGLLRHHARSWDLVAGGRPKPRTNPTPFIWLLSRVGLHNPCQTHRRLASRRGSLHHRSRISNSEFHGSKNWGCASTPKISPNWHCNPGKGRDKICLVGAATQGMNALRGFVDAEWTREAARTGTRPAQSISGVDEAGQQPYAVGRSGPLLGASRANSRRRFVALPPRTRDTPAPRTARCRGLHHNKPDRDNGAKRKRPVEAMHGPSRDGDRRRRPSRARCTNKPRPNCDRCSCNLTERLQRNRLEQLRRQHQIRHAQTGLPQPARQHRRTQPQGPRPNSDAQCLRDGIS